MNISPLRFRGQFVFEQVSPEVKSELDARQKYQSGVKNPDYPQVNLLENSPNAGDVTVQVTGGIPSKRSETHQTFLQLAERLGAGFRFIADRVKTRAEKQASLAQLESMVVAKANAAYQQRHAAHLAHQQAHQGPQGQLPFAPPPAPTLNAQFQLGHGDSAFNIIVQTNEDAHEVGKALEAILQEKSLPGLRTEARQYGIKDLYMDDTLVHVYNQAPQPPMYD